MERLTAPEPGTLRHFFENTYLPQRSPDTSDVHRYVSRLAYARLHKHYGRDIQLTELTDALLADHLRWLRDKEGLRASSINNGHRAIIVSSWRYAHELGLLTNPPRVRKYKEEKHEPDSWSEKDIAKLIEACDIMKDFARWPSPIPCEKWWRAFLLTAWWTGLRAGSLRGIRWDDVDLASGWIYINPSAMKTKHGKRFRIGQDAIQAIRDIVLPPRELVFEWPFQRDTIWRQFRRIQKAAGLQHNGRGMSRLHKVRRSTATAAASNAGLPAAIALLGHSGPQITARYIDPSRMPGTDATEFLPKLNLGGDP